MEQYYYSSLTGQTYSAYQMQALFGIDVNTMDISILNDRGFYPVQESSPEFDTQLYDTSSTWVIVSISPSGEGAKLNFTAVAKPLPDAKANASTEEKDRANTETAQIIFDSGLSTDVLTSVASQDPLSRPADFQLVLDATTTVSDQLASNLTAIDAATSVNDINEIVNPIPTFSGILSTGRGGVTPDDLNVSYYITFNSSWPNITEADTELYYAPTATVLPYLPAQVPPGFDSFGDLFNGVDYEIQIRVAATSQVIATFTVPDNGVTNVEISF